MRVENWRAALFRVLLARSRQEFAFGANDCCIFAAACVDAMTGSAHVAELTSRYRGPKGAARLLRELGGIEGAVRSILGDPSTGQIRTGDVVVFAQKRGELTCGISIGPLVVAPGATRLEFIRRPPATVHWSI